MALDVKVKIDLVKPAGSINFGIPLILSKVGDSGSAIAYTECADVESVKTAGFAETTDTYKAAKVMFSQKHPPAKIAVCSLSDITSDTLATLTGYSWRQLVTVGGIEAAAVKAYIDTTDKLYFAGLESVTALTALAGTSTKTYSDRVVPVVHSTNAELAAAALAAEVAGNTVGSITYKNLILNGIESESLSDAQIDAIHAAHGNTVLKKAGDVVLSEGFVESGEYADIIDAKDYIIQNLTYKTQKVLNTMGKIPYDNRGISILENVAVDVMKDAYNKDMIAEDDDGNPMYSVAYENRSDMTAENIASRKYTGGRFAFTLSGAIHNVDVTGEISVA